MRTVLGISSGPSRLDGRGDWTPQPVARELAHQGLANRSQRGKPAASITWEGEARILANPVYVGVQEF